MAKNSFLLKGWAITLIGALFALTFKEVNAFYLIVSATVLFLFWFMDGFYLSRERLFIKLYNKMRMVPERDIDFSLDISSVQGCYDWPEGIFSRTLIVFYGGLILVHGVVYYLIT